MNAAIALSVIDSCTLIYVEVDENSNKVWQGKVLNDGSFVVEWGRVGNQLQSKVYYFNSIALAQNKLDRIKRQKLRKGYTEAQVINQNKNYNPTLKEEDLEVIAAKQIEHGKDPRAKQLIRYLVAVNIHNITSQTNISYDVTTGNFSTPLGLVTPEAIALARDYLIQIANSSHKNNRSTRSLINNYLRLIPQKLGSKIDYVRFLSTQEIQRQYEILNALNASIDRPQDERDNQVFECSIRRIPGSSVDGRKIFRELNQLYESTINNNHLSATYKMRRIYEINIPSMSETFTKKATEIGNVKLHWHGTRASNLLSILKHGLIIPPANAAQCTGRMFGNGIYGSEQSTKALNYATNYWNQSGEDDQRVYMLLCEFAMGKEYHLQNNYQGNLPVSGYDSTYVKPGSFNVMNQESIVYNTAQVNIKYLCEFS
jgi:poly [ADP-ribose] polymerase 2/3/4